MIENVSTQLTVFHCFAHCLLPGRAFASLYVLLFLEKEAEIGGRDLMNSLFADLLSGLQIEWELENYFLYFSSKIYVVGTQKNRLNEHPRHMFKLMDKKIFTILRSLKFLV